jgi:HEXXH motif-containing protein
VETNRSLRYHVMHPDVEGVRRFRNQRLRETIEDAFALLLHEEQQFNREGLEEACRIYEQSSETALKRLSDHPKTGMWYTVDLSPLIESPDSSAAQTLAVTLRDTLLLSSLALAAMDGRAYSVRLPALPNHFILPGLGVSLDGGVGDRPDVLLSTTEKGVILIDGKSVSVNSPPESGGFVIVNGDSTLALPDLEGYVPSSPSVALTEEWSKILTESLELLSRSPASKALVYRFGNHVGALERAASGAHLSVSFKSRPGIIYASASEDIFEVTEALVHESDHQCLYEVINEDAILTPAAENLKCVYRSPWRPDPRPMSGVFFGLGAFVSVGAFWTDVFFERANEASDKIGKRAVLALEQAVDAISVVDRFADMTERGRMLLDYNREAATQALDRFARHPAFQSYAGWSKARRGQDSEKWHRAHGTTDRAVSLT